MEDIQLLREYLGGMKGIGNPRTELDFIPIIYAGFPVSLISSLSEKVKLSEGTISHALSIAPRTLARRKKHAVRFKRLESELLFRLAQVSAVGTRVLGSGEKAGEWLNTSNRALRGERPISLLDTQIGFQAVLDLLGRIEHGVFS